MWEKVVCMSKIVQVYACLAYECVHGRLASYKLRSRPQDLRTTYPEYPSPPIGSIGNMQGSSGEILKKNRWFPNQDSHQHSVKAEAAPFYPEPQTPTRC